MRATQLRIHNYRSITDVDIQLCPYGLLVGPNGAGKSNVLASIRTFYDELKFVAMHDFPKLPTADNESWVEIQYKLSPDEARALKKEYLDAATQTFRVRRYFQTEQSGDDGKSMSGGVFGYTDGTLNTSRFYGAKNVQQAKLGTIVYVPAVAKLDDHTKLTGPSSLRDLVNLVLKERLESSSQFENLTKAFDRFRKSLRRASGGPLDDLQNEITQQMDQWGHRFTLDVRSLGIDELLRSLVAPKIIDGDLDEELEPSAFGHGFQRHIIYSLMMLAARHTTVKKPPGKKIEFDPELFWVLYEEPEAFLHPPQAETLNLGLRNFAKREGHQVTVTTHSPVFASKSLGEIGSLVRLSRSEKATEAGQVRETASEELFGDNQEVVKKLIAAGLDVHAKDTELEMEAIKYSLWLDPLRSSALFAQRVLLVEGVCERALVGYLVDQGEIVLPPGGLSVIDTMGKYNLHRFMNLLGKLCIHHVVLFDRDERPKKDDADRTRNEIFNQAVEAARNRFTIGVSSLDEDLEASLGIVKEKGLMPHQKPQHLLHAVVNGLVDPSKLNAFVARVQNLISSGLQRPDRAGQFGLSFTVGDPRFGRDASLGE